MGAGGDGPRDVDDLRVVERLRQPAGRAVYAQDGPSCPLRPCPLRRHPGPSLPGLRVAWRCRLQLRTRAD